MLGMRLFLAISLCSKCCPCSRGLSLHNFLVSVFPYELKPVMGLLHPLAVVTLASVEAGKCLLSLRGGLSGPVSEQDNSALPGVAALGSFGLPASSSGLWNHCTSLPELCLPTHVSLRQGFTCCFSTQSFPMMRYKGVKKNNQGNYGPEHLAASFWSISLEDRI